MPITMPIATLIGSAIGGGTAIAGMRSNRSAQREASALESRFSDQALADARAEREYQRQRDDENRRYEREQLEREYGYRSGRDAVLDSRFNDERDYGRGEFASYKARLAPFTNIGTRSAANLASVVGRALPASIPTAGNGAMVRLQSPTGQVQEVPADHAEFYMSRGAKRV